MDLPPLFTPPYEVLPADLPRLPRTLIRRKRQQMAPTFGRLCRTPYEVGADSAEEEGAAVTLKSSNSTGRPSTPVIVTGPQLQVQPQEGCIAIVEAMAARNVLIPVTPVTGGCRLGHRRQRS